MKTENFCTVSKWSPWFQMCCHLNLKIFFSLSTKAISPPSYQDSKDTWIFLESTLDGHGISCFDSGIVEISLDLIPTANFRNFRGLFLLLGFRSCHRYLLSFWNPYQFSCITALYTLSFRYVGILRHFFSSQQFSRSLRCQGCWK